MADNVKVTIRLTEAGCNFEHTAEVAADTSFRQFKEAAERMFDQRLQLSFSHRGPLPRMASPLPSGGNAGRAGTSAGRKAFLHSTSDSAAASPLPSLPNTNTTGAFMAERRGERATSPDGPRDVDPLVHVALDESTWPVFLSNPSATCRAWSVFPGQSLAMAGIGKSMKHERIAKFTEGTADMPQDKKLSLLYKRLHLMAQPVPLRRVVSQRGPRQLNLDRTVTPEEQEKTISRLWTDAETRQEKHKQEQAEEEARVLARMRVRVRRGRPDERSAAEEAFVASLDEKNENLKAKMDALREKYEERVVKVKHGANPIGPEDVETAVGRLYPWARAEGQSPADIKKAMEDHRRRQEEKHFGKVKPQPKLSAEQLQARVQSLYTEAVQKKADKVKQLEERIIADAPSPTRTKISKQKADELLGRLAAK